MMDKSNGENRRISDRHLEEAARQAREVVLQDAEEAKHVIARATDFALKITQTHEIEIKVLSERVANWIEGSESYRKSLCAKIDIITDKLSVLPCKQGEEVSKAQSKEIGWLQKGAMVIICSLFGIGVWTGNINTTTNNHEKRLNAMETIEQEAQKIRATNVAKIQKLEEVAEHGKSNRV